MPATYRTTFHWQHDGVPMQTHMDWATPATDATLAEAIEINSAIAIGSVYSAMLDVLPTDAKITGITTRSFVADGGSATGTPTAVQIIADDPGSRTGDVGSNQDAAVISFAPFAFPGERPRTNKMFIGPISKTDYLEDHPTAGLKTALTALRDACLAGFSVTSGAVNWIAIVKVLGVSIARAIVASQIEDFVASQNRRRPQHA